MELLREEKLFTILLISALFLFIIDPSLGGRLPQLLKIDTLSAIISFLLISHLMELSGLFNRVILKLSRYRLSDRGFMLLYTLIVSLTAALIMNDTSLFIFTPFIIITAKTMKIDLEKSIVFTCIAANLGSALTPFGNPQNIIIWKHYHITLLTFLFTMTPFYLAGYILLALLIVISYKGRRLEVVRKGPPTLLNKLLLTTSTTLLLLNIILIELGYAVVGLLISIATILIVNRRLLYKVDIILILIFALMFIVFGELSLILKHIGVIEPLTNPINILVYSVVLSQVISNVPATIILLNHVRNWIPLAYGVNIGGLGLIIGSMANIIVLRISNMSLREFHRYQIPYFLIFLLVISTSMIISY